MEDFPIWILEQSLIFWRILLYLIQGKPILRCDHFNSDHE